MCNLHIRVKGVFFVYFKTSEVKSNNFFFFQKTKMQMSGIIFKTCESIMPIINGYVYSFFLLWLKFELQSYIYYALSLPIELNSVASNSQSHVILSNKRTKVTLKKFRGIFCKFYSLPFFY